MIKTTLFKALIAADFYSINGEEVEYSGLSDWAGDGHPESIRLSSHKELEDLFFLDQPAEIDPVEGLCVARSSEAMSDGYEEGELVTLRLQVTRPIRESDIEKD